MHVSPLQIILFVFVCEQNPHVFVYTLLKQSDLNGMSFIL